MFDLTLKWTNYFEALLENRAGNLVLQTVKYQAYVSIYILLVWPSAPIILNFIIRPTALHGKNEVRIHKFNIKDPQSFSEIDTPVPSLMNLLERTERS